MMPIAEIWVQADGTATLMLLDRGNWIYWQEPLCDPDGAMMMLHDTEDMA